LQREEAFFFGRLPHAGHVSAFEIKLLGSMELLPRVPCWPGTVCFNKTTLRKVMQALKKKYNTPPALQREEAFFLMRLPSHVSEFGKKK
jgi:hypothetical protein